MAWQTNSRVSDKFARVSADSQTFLRDRTPCLPIWFLEIKRHQNQYGATHKQFELPRCMSPATRRHTMQRLHEGHSIDPQFHRNLDGCIPS
jgi:hypothetical protein